MSLYSKGQSAMSAPGTGPSSDSPLKSMSHNRVHLVSECGNVPPT
ncbi:Uncharacterised protein [Mycobacterium tuberculosis]|nr:Uncharacterised protein [Mycobacterium tuberculosis]